MTNAMEAQKGDSHEPFADKAAAAIARAVGAARAKGLRVSVAVVDAGGHLVGYHRMDGVPYQLVGVAIDKASTAAGFGVATGQLRNWLEHMPSAVMQVFNARRGVVLLAGGVPIKRGAVSVGAIGVSGGTEEEDLELAYVAIEEF